MNSRYSKLLVDDQFEVIFFQKELPLQLPYVLRDGVKSKDAFVAGLNSGLTWLKREGHGKAVD